LFFDEGKRKNAMESMDTKVNARPARYPGIKMAIFRLVRGFCSFREAGNPPALYLFTRG